MKSVARTISTCLLLALSSVMAASTGAAAAESRGTAGQGPEWKAPPTVHYTADFEKGVQPWTAGSNDRSVTPTLTRWQGDNGCNDGGQSFAGLESYPSESDLSNGTIKPDPIGTWATAALDAPGSGGPVDVEVEWTTRNIGGCAGCLPGVYIGTQAPDVDTVLHPLGIALDGEWQMVRYDANLQATDAGVVHVAVGWMGSEASVALDCINVTISAVYDYTYGFEEGVEPWSLLSPDDGEGALERSMGDAGCSMLDRAPGAWHASIRNYIGPAKGLDVPRPPVRAMQSAFPAAAGMTDVQVSWTMRNEYGCKDCTPLVYVGTSKVVQAEQMIPLDVRLTADWAKVEYNTSILTQSAGQVYVAVGWLEPDANQFLRSAGFDCLNIHIEPSDVLP